MDAVILAAGRGSRLGDITAQSPKPMTPLAGKPLFDWQCESLRQAGVEQISVVTGYGANAFDNFSGRRFHNPRWHHSNMVESLRQAAHVLSQTTHIISYGDIAYQPDIVRKLMESSSDIVISCDLDWYALWNERFADPLSDAETFEQVDGRLVAIGERTNDFGKIQGQYMGLLKITSTGWTLISSFLKILTDEQMCQLDMTSLLQGLILSGVNISVVNVRGGWVEVDTPADLILYERSIRKTGWHHDWRFPKREL